MPASSQSWTTIAGYRADVAIFGRTHIHKEAVIEAVNYQHRCYPERSHLQCMIWHGDFELRGRIAIRNRHGLSFLLVFNQIRESGPDAVAADPGNEDNDDTALLRKDLKKHRPVTPLLNDRVPHCTVVRLLSPEGHLQLPDPLEVNFPGGAHEVREELLLWGHHCQCCQQPIFLCVAEDEDHHHPQGGITTSSVVMIPTTLRVSSCTASRTAWMLSTPCGYSADLAMTEQSSCKFTTYWRTGTASFSTIENQQYKFHQVPTVPTRQRSPWPEGRAQQRTSSKL